jgi:sulfoxide reductase heme-binding subunit YedZ
MVLLAIPAFAMAWQLAATTDPRIYHTLVHPTGEASARLLIGSLMASPLALLFRRARFPRWLIKNRRYIGVVAFGYGCSTPCSIWSTETIWTRS